MRAPEGVAPGAYTLAAADGASLPAEVDTSGRLSFVVPDLAARQTVSYEMEKADTDASPPTVEVNDTGGSLSISLRGEPVTTYVYRDVPARPYFHPVFAPGQIPVTRSYPMLPEVEGEKRDHPHHRSLWIAYGEVNGADNWSEEPGHGHTRHEAFEHISSGTVRGSFASRSLWTTANGAPLLTQRLSVTAWASGGEYRLLDFDIRLEATHGDVHFSDTKEGGILSVRVATEMDVPRTGRITNVFGGIDEAETWGRASHWCDYSGTVAGEPAGIAVLDHPHSFRYPTHWHVRNYGLMTANPFGYAAYTDGLKDGSHTLKRGDALAFRYRVALHRGSCTEAQINGRYLDFVAPPRVTLTA